MPNPDNPLTPPILFLVFNRPDTTLRVFQAIRKVRPTRLFIAADGPRQNVLNERETCDQVREIATSIDWDCEVQTLFRDKNLGCRKAVSGAIDWFFDHVSEGIIIEDDCLPAESFFRYCQELLKMYADNKRIMLIGGYNPHQGRKYGKGSYYFSKYALIWGWASWKRAWQCYNDSLDTFEEVLKNKTLKAFFPTTREYIYFTRRFRDTFMERMNSWGYIWYYSMCLQDCYAINPNVNLVKNIGITEDATHTKTANKIITDTPVLEMFFPLNHPTAIQPHRDADKNIFRVVHCRNILLFVLSQAVKSFRRKFSS